VRDVFPKNAIADRVLGLKAFPFAASPPFPDVPASFREADGYRELVDFQRKVDEVGLGGVAVFDPTVVRGLDYYTGIVYEVHDVGTENRRAMFGGGRYDNLLDLFSGEGMTGTGFGMGILTVKLFLETYGLLPADVGQADRRKALYVACAAAAQRGYAFEVAATVRRAGIVCEVDLEFQKLGKQLGRADAKGYGRAAIVGETEAAGRTVTIKTLATGQQETVALAELTAKLRSA